VKRWNQVERREANRFQFGWSCRQIFLAGIFARYVKDQGLSSGDIEERSKQPAWGDDIFQANRQEYVGADSFSTALEQRLRWFVKATKRDSRSVLFNARRF